MCAYTVVSAHVKCLCALTRARVCVGVCAFACMCARVLGRRLSMRTRQCFCACQCLRAHTHACLCSAHMHGCRHLNTCMLLSKPKV